jgi:hypothetical protein
MALVFPKRSFVTMTKINLQADATKEVEVIEAPQAPAYSSPEVVVIGQAIDLVQGNFFSASYKDYDNPYWRYYHRA